MKKNVIFISIILLIILNLSIIGFLIYQNHFIKTKLNELDGKVEKSIASNNHQDTQISQIYESQIKSEQQQALKNLEKGTDESIFEDTSTEGLMPISEDEAKQIWEKYASDMNIVNLDTYNINSIKKEKVKPTNFFTAGAESNVRTADFEREAYILNYVEYESARLEVTAYVDIYTGKVIGGSFKGD